MSLQRVYRAFHSAMRYIEKIAKERKCTLSHFYASDKQDTDTFDDTCITCIAVLGKPRQELVERFANRIAETLCGHNAWRYGAVCLVQEDEKHNAMDVFVVPYKPLGKRDVPCPAILRELENMLRVIQENPYGPHLKGAKEELMKLVMACFQRRLETHAAVLRETFIRHRTRYEDLVEQHFGILNPTPVKYDSELGSIIIALYNLTSTGNTTRFTAETVEKLVEQVAQVFKLERVENVEERLRFLTHSKRFSTELTQCLKGLHRPQLVFETIVRTVNTLSSRIKLHRGLHKRTAPALPTTAPSPIPTQISTPTKTTKKPSPHALICLETSTSESESSQPQPPSTVKPSQSMQLITLPSRPSTPPPSQAPGSADPSPATQLTTPSTPPSNLASSSNQNTTEPTQTTILAPPTPGPKPTTIPPLFAKALPYLDPEDRTIGLYNLQPPAKFAALELAAHVLNTTTPPPSSAAYHPFGYAACLHPHECKILSAFYRRALTQAPCKRTLFDALWTAAHTYTLLTFIVQYNTAVLPALPLLAHFLARAPPARESVFQLVQFVRTAASEAPPVLCADYGFDRAKGREHVLLLKAAYARVLKAVHPLEVHGACVRGELWGLVRGRTGWGDAEVERMLRGRGVVLGRGFERVVEGYVSGGGVFR